MSHGHLQGELKHSKRRRLEDLLLTWTEMQIGSERERSVP